MTDAHTFILHPNRDDIRDNCIAYIESLGNAKSWKVSIKEYVKDRSVESNAGYWGYILTPAAEQLGYESVELLHRLVCQELYGSKQVTFAGKVHDVPNRTTTHPTKMDRKEFNDHKERAAALLTAQGVTLPAPETWFA